MVPAVTTWPQTIQLEYSTWINHFKVTFKSIKNLKVYLLKKNKKTFNF